LTVRLKFGRRRAKSGPASAIDALQAGAQSLVAAFRKEARLSGAGRAALQAAVMGRVRRYIEANPHQRDLTPTSVVQKLPRTAVADISAETAMSVSAAAPIGSHAGTIGAPVRLMSHAIRNGENPPNRTTSKL
jgi:hypothetical protein